MRTTLDIDDTLLAEAKALAARERTTLTRLIEQGLAIRLRSRPSPKPPRPTRLPVYPGRGGLQAGVADATTHRALLDAADDDGNRQ